MQWSQLKKRLESTFTASVRGRVELWVTRYRHANEEAGEAWITFDKQRLVSMGTWTYEAQHAKVRDALGSGENDTNPQNTEQQGGDGNADEQASRILRERGIYSLKDAYMAFSAYLNLSIDEVLASENPIVRALGVLDKRFGKRRLRAFDASCDALIVKKMYKCRCLCDGVPIQPISNQHE